MFSSAIQRHQWARAFDRLCISTGKRSTLRGLHRQVQATGSPLRSEKLPLARPRRFRRPAYGNPRVRSVPLLYRLFPCSPSHTGPVYHAPPIPSTDTTSPPLSSPPSGLQTPNATHQTSSAGSTLVCWSIRTAKSVGTCSLWNTRWTRRSILC